MYQTGKFIVENSFFLIKINAINKMGVYYILSSSGVASGLDVKFKDALGFAIEVDYWRNEHVYFGGKFTMINYELKNSSISVDGNSIGVVMGYVFGN